MARRRVKPSNNRWMYVALLVVVFFGLGIALLITSNSNHPQTTTEPTPEYFIPMNFPPIPLNGYGELYIGDVKLEGNVVILLGIKVNLSEDGMTATGAEITLDEIWLDNLDQIILNTRDDGSIGQITLRAFNEMPLVEGHLDTDMGRIVIPPIAISAGDNHFTAGNIKVFPLSWDSQGSPIRGSNQYRQI